MGRYNLFAEGRQATGDAQILLELTDGLLYGQGHGSLQDDLMQLGSNAAGLLKPRLLAGEVPVVALQVLTSLSLVSHPKDYNAHACWGVALALADALPGPHPGLSEPDDDDHAEQTVAFATWLGGVMRRAQAGETRDEHERAVGLSALALGPLGLCSQSVFEWLEGFPFITNAATGDLHWRALGLVCEVMAGSEGTLEQLSSLVDTAPDALSLLWFDELLCRLAGHDARADERARLLDARLTRDTFGTNGAALCGSLLKLSRAFPTNDLAATQAAWRSRTERRASSEVRDVVESAAHYLTMTSRMLRGLELLAPSAQELARRLSGDSS